MPSSVSAWRPSRSWRRRVAARRCRARPCCTTRPAGPGCSRNPIMTSSCVKRSRSSGRTATTPSCPRGRPWRRRSSPSVWPSCTALSSASATPNERARAVEGRPMLRRMVASSLRYRFIVVAIAVGTMLFGVQELRSAPVDVFPEFAPPRVEIQTAALGLSANEVESFVTVPLEQALAGLPALDILRSNSVAQLSQIELIFKPDADLMHARQLVQERIESVTPSLPTWAAPPFMMPPVSATSRVMKIGMSSKSMSVMDMSLITYWTIRSRLLSVPGVANIPIWGEQLNQLHVKVIPEKMATAGITLDQVMEGTADSLDAGILMFSEAHAIGTGGFVESPNQRLPIEHVPPIITQDELKRVVLINAKGESVHLSDIAEVVKDHQPLFGDAIVNDGPG